MCGAVPDEDGDVDEEPTKSFWVRIKDQTSMGSTVVGVCYRLLGE